MGSSVLSGMGVGKAQVGMGLLGVAFAAFEHYQQQQAPAQPQSLASSPPPPPPPPTNTAGTSPHQAAPPPPPLSPASVPVSSPSRDHDLMLVVETMISAAHADGRIDADERSGILEKAMQLELGADQRKQLLVALEQPPSIAQISARARPEIAADLYAAAVLAITIDTDAERQWLQALGSSLGLDQATCNDIESSFRS